MPPEDELEDLPHRIVVFECQQELHRPLAHVARAPRGTLVLLQAVRGGQVNERVVDHPWEDGVESGDFRAIAFEAHLPAHAGPELAGCVQHRGHAHGTFVFPREPAGLGGIGHGASHGEAELAGGCGAHRDIGHPARLAIRI